jgi:hypothetical protein
MLENEAWGRPRDIARLPNPRGNGFWTQEVYYHILNCGLRIPPSAGSASGVLPNPVGYNRVYVHLDEPLTCDSWFKGLAEGRSFVTNGPLLVVKANGKLPGGVIKVDGEKGANVTLEIELTSNDRVPRIELIANGEVAKTIDCTDAISQRHTMRFSVNEAGWFLVRAITDKKETFRFASTAPWYVETDRDRHRISRRSANFFADWVDERIKRVEANVEEEAQRRDVLAWHHQAREFWLRRKNAATAE